MLQDRDKRVSGLFEYVASCRSIFYHILAIAKTYAKRNGCILHVQAMGQKFASHLQSQKMT